MKILIVEDEPGIRLTLEDRLMAEGYHVESRADGISGEEAAFNGSPDLIILDLMLPGRDGLTICKNLVSKGITTPILMLTARNTDFDVVLGLRQGADDYLAKPFVMDILVARVEALLRRHKQGGISVAKSPMTIEFGRFLLDRQRGLLLEEGRPIELNAQEYRLLEYLVVHPGMIHERDDLLDKVWSYGADVSSRTVDVHVAKLRQRLGESDLPRHIITIRNRGYRFDVS